MCTKEKTIDFKASVLFVINVHQVFQLPRHWSRNCTLKLVFCFHLLILCVSFLKTCIH